MTSTSSKTMRAVLIKDGKGPSDNLFIGEVEKPKPGKGEVLVKIVAFGLNRMDISQRKGTYPVPPGTRSDILGVEFSGTIAEFGEGCSVGWKVGDEVFGLVKGGAYAEYIQVSELMISPKPSHLSFVEAAGILENWLTAYQAVIEISNLQQGEDILVHATASGVGIAAVQLAHLRKARRIVGTVSSAEKIEFLKSMPNGPTDIVNYKTTRWPEEIKKLADGVDVIVDFIGGDYWEGNVESLNADGRLVLLATMGGNFGSKTNISRILSKRLRIQGSTLRSRSAQYQGDLVKTFAKDVLPLFVAEKSDGEGLRVYVHKVFKWEKIREAHDEMEANKNCGKIIVEVS